MKIGNLKKIATVGLALGAINSTVAVNERALSNSVTPKVVDLENMLKANEVKKEDGEIVPECRWNDYVGTYLAASTSLVTIPPVLGVVGLANRAGLLAKDRDDRDVCVAIASTLPSMAMRNVFRVSDNCIGLTASKSSDRFHNVANNLGNAWNEFFGVRI